MMSDDVNYLRDFADYIKRRNAEDYDGITGFDNDPPKLRAVAELQAMCGTDYSLPTEIRELMDLAREALREGE